MKYLVSSNKTFICLASEKEATLLLKKGFKRITAEYKHVITRPADERDDDTLVWNL
jgi:hypothetical protein